MDSESTSAESIRPIPPRYWWLKRIGATVVLLLIGLGLLRWWWGVKAHRALQAEIDRLVATGQPVFPEDFRPDPVPDDQNAAILLKQAADALSLTKAEQQLLGRIRGDAKKYHDNVGEVREILNRTASSRDLVRESRERAGADWGWSPPNLSTPPPSLLPYSDLLAMLGAAALDAHSRGDDAEAVEILRDMLESGHRLRTMSILLASFLDFGAAGQVADTLAAWGPSLRIGIGQDEPGDANQPASRRQIEDLVAELLNDQAFRRDFRRAFYAERIISINAITLMTDGSYSPGLTPATSRRASLASYLLKPMFELDGVRMLRKMTMMAEAAGAPDCPTALTLLPAPVSRRSLRGLAGATHILSLIYVPNFQDAIVGSFRTAALRRMAAVALAVHLYELDHGQLPEQLGQLVPRYVQALPPDPFSDDGRTVGYRPTSSPPVLYCVGLPPDKGGKTGELTFPLRAKAAATAPTQAQTRPVSR